MHTFPPRERAVGGSRNALSRRSTSLMTVFMLTHTGRVPSFQLLISFGHRWRPEISLPLLSFLHISAESSRGRENRAARAPPARPPRLGAPRSPPLHGLPVAVALCPRASRMLSPHRWCYWGYWRAFSRFFPPSWSSRAPSPPGMEPPGHGEGNPRKSGKKKKELSKRKKIKKK